MDKKIAKNVSSGAKKVERVEAEKEYTADSVNANAASKPVKKTAPKKTAKSTDTPSKSAKSQKAERAKKKERAVADKRIEAAKKRAQKKEEKLMEYNIIRLVDMPEWKENMARWFHEKWGIPLAAYLDSMDECLMKKGAVPQWYIAIENSQIIGGMGVIENDFHDRKDLSPNVCAVYTEENKRCQGIAGSLLDFVCDDMK